MSTRQYSDRLDKLQCQFTEAIKTSARARRDYEEHNSTIDMVLLADISMLKAWNEIITVCHTSATTAFMAKLDVLVSATIELNDRMKKIEELISVSGPKN